MFQESLVESTNLLRSNNRWPAVASFAAQALIVAIFIALPILHPEVLYLRPPSIALVPPNLRPTPPPPPPTQPLRVVSAIASLPAPAMAPAASTIRRIPSQTTSEPSEAPNFNNTTISMTDGSNPFGSIIGIGTGPHTSVVPAPAPAVHNGPINVSKGVMAGMLLAPIHAEYPHIAVTTRTEGTVVVQAIISKSGTIEYAHVISGPPMLQSAALQAVQAARYRPYMLNGSPTEVETTISINFHIGS